MHTSPCPICTDSDPHQVFQQKSLDLSRIARRIGLPFRPYSDETLPLFAQLDRVAANDVLRRLQLTHEIYSELLASEAQLTSGNLAWIAFGRTNTKPSNDFFSHLSDGDCVTLYDDRGVQLSSNLQFFRLCSYTFEEIACVSWDHLWERRAEDAELMLRSMQELLADNDDHSTRKFNFTHIVKERFSRCRYEINYQLKAASPLWNRETNQKVGFVVIEAGAILNQLTPEEEERFLLRGAPALYPLG